MNKELEDISPSEFYKLVDINSVFDTLYYIQENEIALKPSTKYSVILDGKPFPPKDFLRVMAELKGYKINEASFNGGQANKPFKDLNFLVLNNNILPPYNSSLINHCIEKYQTAIKKTDWLKVNELYKFNFIKWIDNNINFQSDSDEEIKAKIELSQKQKYPPDTEKGVNFITSIVRYHDEYITLDDISKIKKIINGELHEDKESLTLSFNSFPKTSVFLSLFAPRQYMFYDGESFPAFEYFFENESYPKKDFKAFIFFQIFYRGIKETLKNSNLDISLFKNILEIDTISEIYWNFITQDFLLYTKREIMDSNQSSSTSSTPSLSIEKQSQTLELNQILYGPPGTGKTYKTKQIAVEIIDGEAPENREELTKRYNKLIDNQQICFTTFHQSMGYEDFIEGIKPVMNGSQDLIYEVKDGIFKSMCSKATKSTTSDNFEEVYKRFIEDVSTQGKLELKTPIQEKPFDIKVNSNQNCIAVPHTETATNMVVTKTMIKKYILENKITDWKTYTTAIGDYIKKEYKVKVEDIDNKRPYVIIIDEINRGNISSIFGELITLIEKDKRAEEKESIEVILPYSQDKFSVPNNLYIIGTMNTADRSVEALDTALRRRFSFVEILPDSSLIKSPYKDVDLSKILNTINQRIEYLIDKDHQIGHSYFFNITKLEDLKHTFINKIIPLLEEYFYGDFGKIGLVLGDEFVKVKENTRDILAKNFRYNTDFIEDKDIYELVSPDNWTAESFQSIYSPNIEDE